MRLFETFPGRFFGVWVPILVLSFLAPPAQMAEQAGDVLPDTVQKIKSSVVAVGTFVEIRRPAAEFMGTGFVVTDGLHVVTNAHIFRRGDVSTNRKAGKVSALAIKAVFVGRGEDFTVRKASLVAEDTIHDVAILEISGEPLPALSLGDDLSVREGQAVAFTGFPIGTVLGLYPVTHRGIVSSVTPIVRPVVSMQQIDAEVVEKLRDPFDVFQLDATAYPGNSGSPLYDPRTGEVYGIVSSVFVKRSKENLLEDPSGITYAIPIRHVRDLLELKEAVK